MKDEIRIEIVPDWVTMKEFEKKGDDVKIVFRNPDEVKEIMAAFPDLAKVSHSGIAVKS